MIDINFIKIIISIIFVTSSFSQSFVHSKLSKQNQIETSYEEIKADPIFVDQKGRRWVVYTELAVDEDMAYRICKKKGLTLPTLKDLNDAKPKLIEHILKYKYLRRDFWHQKQNDELGIAAFTQYGSVDLGQEEFTPKAHVICI